MAGHSKWAQIKRKKAVVDAKKSKIFSLFSKMIAEEARKSKGDRTTPNLRAVIERARAANLPNDNIDRAVDRGSSANAVAYEEVTYEAYGPGGSALIIEGITDNKNRTTPEIKHLLAEFGVVLGGQGSVVWAFKKTEESWVAKTKIPLVETDHKKLIELVESLENHEDIKNVQTNAL